MAFEKIENLLASDETEKTMVTKLNKWFSKDASLLSHLYRLDRTIFHNLILKQKYIVFEALLKTEAWRAMALLGDRTGRTVLHYAASGDVSYERFLKLLIKYFPESLNITDKRRNTPLHEAVINNRLWAVKMLMEQDSVNRSLRNEKEESPMDLTGDNVDLKHALFDRELSRVDELDLRFRLPNTSSQDLLQREFPLLSSQSQANNASPNSRPTQFSLPSLRLPSLRVAERNLTQLDGKKITFDNEEMNADQLKSLFTKLVSVSNQSASYSEANELQAQFDESCLQFSLEDIIDFNQTDLQTWQVRMILSRTMNFLYPHAQKQYSLIQHQFSVLHKSFAYLLVKHDALIKTPPVKELDTNKEDYKRRTELVKILWLLTAGQVTPNSPREFNFTNLYHRVLGLLSSYPLMDILKGLRQIYVDCDLAQKSILNFVVLQLLAYQATEQIPLTPSLRMQLRFLMRRNEDPSSELGKFGAIINGYLEKVIQLNSDISRPLLFNYNLLRQKLNHATFIQLNESFDDMVKQALLLPTERRVELVKLIAYEFRALIMIFYQRVSLTEFKDGAWLKEERKLNAPYISGIIEQFDKLSAYFCEKILIQPTNNIPNTLQFIIELCQHLCPLDDENHPDLNHLMMMASVLIQHDVSRLTNAFNLLLPTDLRVIEEVNKAISTRQNFKFLQDIYNAYRSTLPYIGKILTEVIFAEAGNENELDRAEMVGSILRKMMEIKILVSSERVTHYTTLPVFLEKYIPLREEVLNEASLSHQPKPENRRKSQSDSLKLQTNISRSGTDSPRSLTSSTRSDTESLTSTPRSDAGSSMSQTSTPRSLVSTPRSQASTPRSPADSPRPTGSPRSPRATHKILSRSKSGIFHKAKQIIDNKGDANDAESSNSSNPNG